MIAASRHAIWGLLLVACLLLAAQPVPAQALLPAASGLSAEPDSQATGRYIVQLAGEPLAAFLSRGAGAAGGGRGRQLDLQGQPAQQQQARLAAQRMRALGAIERRLGAAPPLLHVYDVAFNGVAVELTPAQARAITGLPGVVAVQAEQIYELTTDAGPAWIGADQIWDASATGVYAATILGANESPAVISDLSGRGTFSFDAGSGTLAYTVVISGPTASITAAQLYRATNDSVVAALAPGATAGTYAGSSVLSAGDIALLESNQLYVSVSTAAHPDGEARGEVRGYQGEGVIVGVIDSGINTTHPSFAEVGGDGYRHLNPLGQGIYKGACDPANLPAQANGNPSGYNPAIACNNKLIGAWTFAETAPVANALTGEPSPNDEDGHGSHTASTAAGNVLNNVTLDDVTYPRVSGVAPHANIIAYDVCGYISNGFYSASCPGATLLAAVNRAVADQVDVISYSISGGVSPWEDAIEQAFLNARAAGIVVSTSAGNRGPTLGTVNHLSPWLLSVAAASHNRRISLGARVVNAAFGDIMASFSSRGPAAGTNADLLKPDLAAPGVDVFAAYANSGGATADYELLDGTSMAAPHVSGSAALLIGLHPDWTPGQVQSALMTTSLAPIKKEDGSTPTTPFDSGAGRVRLDRAARAGLVLDETPANFTAANPAAGGDPRTLNVASMANARCVFSCSWTRTVRNTLAVPVTWTATTGTASLTVSPPTFTIPAAGAQVLTFTLDVSAKPFGTYVFDQATLSASGGLAPDASFPLAALPQASDLPATRTLSSASSVVTDTLSINTIAYGNLGAQASGLTRGTQHDVDLPEGGFDISTTLSVPANTARLVAEIKSSTSKDVDIYVYHDANANGAPDISDDLVCQSASSAVEEYCNLDNPTAGTYFVRVDNYAASSSGATDPITLLTAVVPQAPAGNLSIEAPVSSAGGPLSVKLKLNAPSSSQGDYWYGRVSLSDTASSTPLGIMNYDFHHALSGPAALTASAGSGQPAPVNTTFASGLTVIVTDGTGGRVAGVTVTFSAPGSGASATFPDGNSAVTDQNGMASVTARANSIAGSYLVTASASGVSGQLTATFALENTQPHALYLPIMRR